MTIADYVDLVQYVTNTHRETTDVSPITYRQAIEQYGFSIVEGVIGTNQIAALKNSLQSAIQRSDAKSYAMRRLLEAIPMVRQLCSEVPIRNLVEPILGKKAFPVRGIFFDKNPQANWGVSWHQDMTIAVKKRINIPDFKAWSIKDGIHHVQPPISILERMLTLRIHLDNTFADNAPLQVIPNSHKRGSLKPEIIQSLKVNTLTCPVSDGGVLAMRPLLVHASQPARNPRHRRVIHIEFVAEELPDGLEWYGS
ncbi:phytanoyl-CoA dioxygenase family protein [Argonema antarcticum]|uniref:phytanoyl-CoA dioxygenase family protein n=1 Tax=Argonema antarcticum TaxID=2942763 RepID=UPI0020124190|nr:phytanoyl-CoA dioxygenase family protein [Argonema antarcticum]MCL1472329.1 phytanoyl-CoA dioxygenase family protein [Argonema antarcticum A004/B2]